MERARTLEGKEANKRRKIMRGLGNAKNVSVGQPPGLGQFLAGRGLRSASNTEGGRKNGRVVRPELLEEAKNRLEGEIGNILGIEPQISLEKKKGANDWMEKSKAYRDYRQIRHGLDLKNPRNFSTQFF
jgi:hypothetical protein